MDLINSKQMTTHAQREFTVLTWLQMLAGADGALWDPDQKCFFLGVTVGKHWGEMKTRSFGQYFAWQVEKGERKTSSVPLAMLCNLVESQKQKHFKKMFPTRYNTSPPTQ